MKYFFQRIVRRFRRKNITNLTNPVLVYQMGKVASSSIYRSLMSTEGVNVFHIHRLNPDNIESVKQEHIRRGATPPNGNLGLYLFEYIIKPKRAAKIISLIRDPISRNISAYFQNLEVFENMKNAHSYLETDELISNFLKKYNHDVPLNWFDVEMKCTVGIDVFKYEFPKDLGVQTISYSPYELLLMRYDLDDDVKTGLISDFLNLQSFSIKRANESASKNYAQKYRACLESIAVPLEYTERMLQSRYAQHFYTDEELGEIRRRWTHS